MTETPLTISQLELHGRLASFRGLFSSLSAPDPNLLRGIYQAEFVGPLWLRLSAGPALALGGLRGWWGKEFAAHGQASNLVRRGKALQQVLPMSVDRRISLIDGKPGVTLIYPAGSPFPWFWIVDELREIDKDHLLGMTLVNRGSLRKLTFPFLLCNQSEK